MSVSQEHAYLELVQSSSVSSEVKETFSSWAKGTVQRLGAHQDEDSISNLLTLIPEPDDAECLPLISLSFLLSQYEGPSSTFDILRYYTRLWQRLPEAVKAGHDNNAAHLMQDVHHQITKSITTLSGLFSSTSNLPALVDPSTQRSLSHEDLSCFIRNFGLPATNLTSNAQTVVLALHNGPLLGLACMAVASYYTAAPINIAGGPEQFRSDVELARPQCILTMEADIERLGLREAWVAEANIQILVIQPNADLTFDIRNLDETVTQPHIISPQPNSPDDLALILFTSGTSGTKKVVPMTCLSLLTGVTCVIDSWGLTSEDSCVNMMPLNHVGGLVRNLFAPILAGGSTILCPAFDPNLFWDILEEGRGSWYYASPSMHMSILAEGSLRPDSLARCKLRLVCNAAGGLLPALAARLRDTFRCTVLPSYGMTECMPISTPPLGYTLDRVGTSGIGCGPEISILDESDNIVPTGQVGRINVRGGPTFVGYLKGDVVDKSAFNKDGWFDTGDLGSLDQDGYLYLTGRGKEVINRGGELISPFEVEEAITIASQNAESPLFGRVKQVLAFSAPHEVLQEVVGVALVTPPGQPRPDIRCLHRVLKSSLHQPKWPIVIVYMDALPTSNNKIVRIKFGERLGMQPITDDHSLLERHFEAVCPPVNSLLSTKIPNSPCKNETGLVFSVVDEFLKSLEVGLDAHVGVSHHDGSPEVFLAPNGTVQDESLSDYDIDRLRSLLHEKLDGFLVPSSITRLPTPFPRTASGVVDENELDEILKAMKASHSSPAASETEQTIRRAFGEVLGFDTNDISSDSEFFELGGDSLSAGRLLSILRRDMQVRIPVDQLFGASRVSELRDLVDSVLQRDAKTSSDSSTELPMPGCTETYSSTNPLVLFIQLLPIVFFYPIKMGFQWTLLMYSLSTIGAHWSEPNVAARFLALVASMFISRAITQIVAPILGILFKWIVIGKYKQGMYPMWGPYHTRWWIVQKVLLISGKGVFRHHDITRLLYYRLLGAKIGSGVTIETGTILGEYDLLEIGDNVHLDRCIVRPFAAERNTSMYLGKITIGKNSSVGLKSHVAAGSIIPEDTFIGPNSSSYEMSDNQNAPRSQMIKPKTHPLLHFFCIIPIQVLVLFISSLPWMGGLWGIVMSEPTQTVDSVKTVIIWWATPHRITFHYIAQILNVAARPFVWFALVATIKKIVDVTLGPSTPKSAEQKTQKDIFKIALLTALVPGGSLHKITKLFGTHYEFTSMAVRAMGGKVGRRVYWPGTGPTIQDFDLIEIGDDVVFGSRSHLVTSDAFGSDRVRIGSGAMIADRAVLSPGTVVEEGAVLGSGAFIPRDLSCPRDSVWVGNRKGSAICLTGALNATRAVKTQSSFLTTGNNTPLPSYPGSPVATDNQRGFRSNNTNNAITPLPSYPGSPRLSKEFLAHKDSRTFDSSAMEKGAVVDYSSQNPSIITTSDENSESTSSSPFGRAFYEGKAPYHVLGPIPIFLYSTFTTIFVQCYWNSGTISTLMLAAIMQRSHQFPIRWWRPLKIYAFASGFLSGIFIILSISALLICIVAKWSLLGRRKPGSYDWDKSSYCQRWQIFLTIEAVRRRCFGGNGVIGMLTGTHWCVLYFRALGANIGKDCALFAGGRPSLTFTEPDLLTLGDRVTTDDSSLVGHINSRGNFSLNNLRVGNRSVLRSGSRLLSGATMGEDVVLLEHTLIMSGDVADDGLCYQGWPADVYRGDRLNIGSKAEA